MKDAIPGARLCVTDGQPAALIRVVCAWCRKDLPAKVCEPAQAWSVSHGMCEDCRAGFLARMAPAPSFSSASSSPSMAASGPMQPESPGVTGLAAPGQQQRENATGEPGEAEEFIYLVHLDDLRVVAFLIRTKRWAAHQNSYLARMGSMCRWLSVGDLEAMKKHEQGKGRV